MLRRSSLALLLLAAPVAAQQAPPGCTMPEQRQFDFWVGEWNVTDSTGAVTYGTSSVTREEAGCLVHEHWAGAKAGTGQSLNFLDRRTGQWTQAWVGSAGGTLIMTGHLEGTAMVLVGEGLNPKGQVVINKVQWIPEPDGRVRQFWQVSRDGGQSWVTAFDGWYRRK